MIGNAAGQAGAAKEQGPDQIKARFLRLGSEYQEATREAWSARTFGWALWRAAVDEGLLALADAATPGKAIADFGAALEGLAAGSGDPGFLIVPITHCALGMGVIRDEGAPGVREEWLARLATGDEILAFAITEAAGGTDALRPATTLSPDGDAFRLDGAKWHITSAPLAGLVVVWAADPEKADIVGVLVDTRWEGVSVSAPLAPAGTRSAPVGSLRFEGVRIPADHLVGRGWGRAVLNGALVRERILAAFCCVGTMERALGHAFEFAVSRQVFGAPIATHQHIQRRLCDIKLRLDTTRGLISAVLAKVDNGDRYVLEASQVKMYAVRSAIEAVSEAMQVCGSYGLQEDVGFYQMLLDCLSSTVAGGTEEAHRMVIMRELASAKTTGDQKTVLHLLPQFPAFSDCPTEELAELATHCSEVRVPAGRAFIIEGTPGDSCYIIIDGQVRVSRAGEDLAQLGPGHLVGEVALLEQRPRTATVSALTPLRLLSMDAAEFNGWLNERPQLRQRFLASRAHGGDYSQ